MKLVDWYMRTLGAVFNNLKLFPGENFIFNKKSFFFFFFLKNFYFWLHWVLVAQPGTEPASPALKVVSQPLDTQEISKKSIQG